MWLRGKWVDNEEEFRFQMDEIKPWYWKNTDLQNLSKDFFREFKDKFEWRDSFGGLTKPALYIWKEFGEKFLMEMYRP